MAVLPVPKTFRLIRGATFDYSFQYLLGTPDNAQPENLTGFTAAWTLHPQSGIITYTTGQSTGHSGVFLGGTGNDPTNGIIDLVISAADTAAFTWKTVRYNLAITSPTSVVTNLLTGSVSVVNTLP